MRSRLTQSVVVPVSFGDCMQSVELTKAYQSSPRTLQREARLGPELAHA